MDDARPLNGLSPEIGVYGQLRESGRGENDLEDHGGDGGGAGGRRRRAPASAALERKSGPVRQAPIADEQPGDLVQALDRMRTVHEVPAVDPERLRALRGVKHYREDPQTTRTFRVDTSKVGTDRTERGTAGPTPTGPAADPGPADDFPFDDDFPAGR